MAVADLQPLLRADETVVAYHSLPDRLLVWMVDRERVRERSLPVPRADLEQLVDAWRDALVHGQTAAVGAGGQIGELLIAPLGLEPGRRLIIVPHGALHYLPRSEEHTSELQSLMRISYAVLCLKKQQPHKT